MGLRNFTLTAKPHPELHCKRLWTERLDKISRLERRYEVSGCSSLDSRQTGR